MYSIQTFPMNVLKFTIEKCIENPINRRRVLELSKRSQLMYKLKARALFEFSAVRRASSIAENSIFLTSFLNCLPGQITLKGLASSQTGKSDRESIVPSCTFNCTTFQTPATKSKTLQRIFYGMFQSALE